MTRSEARAAGLSYYSEGRWPCPVNHQPTKRWVSTGKCFWCARDYERERRRADAANWTARTKEWRRLNPEKVREGNAKRDPEMLRQVSRNWRKKYPQQAAITASMSTQRKGKARVGTALANIRAALVQRNKTPEMRALSAKNGAASKGG